jgi:hypothetical protein
VKPGNVPDRQVLILLLMLTLLVSGGSALGVRDTNIKNESIFGAGSIEAHGPLIETLTLPTVKEWRLECNGPSPIPTNLAPPKIKGMAPRSPLQFVRPQGFF